MQRKRQRPQRGIQFIRYIRHMRERFLRAFVLQIRIAQLHACYGRAKPCAPQAVCRLLCLPKKRRTHRRIPAGVMLQRRGMAERLLRLRLADELCIVPAVGAFPHGTPVNAKQRPHCGRILPRKVANGKNAHAAQPPRACPPHIHQVFHGQRPHQPPPVFRVDNSHGIRLFIIAAHFRHGHIVPYAHGNGQ